jgi:hypothetical protein
MRAMAATETTAFSAGTDDARAARMTSTRVLPLAFAFALACTPSASNVDAATDAPSSSTRSRPERYIRGDLDMRLVIELDAVAGTTPRAAAQSELVSRLGTLLDKPGGITVVSSDVISSRGADHAWTFAELTALGDETFDDDTTPGTVVMHVMWIDGHDADDTSSGAVLGVSWGNLHIAMFHDTIERTCSGNVVLGERLCTETQYGVWLHEVGHTIGLVDDGIPMVTPHSDAAHGAHDSNSSCLMYWAYDGSAGLDLIQSALLGGSSGAPDFDANCLADVAAIRSR